MFAVLVAFSLMFVLVGLVVCACKVVCSVWGAGLLLLDLICAWAVVIGCLLCG